MKKSNLILFFILITFASCSVSDVQRVARAAISKDPSVAFETLVKSKGIEYATNPKRLESDIKNLDKFLETFVENISSIWGEKNVRIPKKKEYVKYMQNYKSRALVDFDNGIVTVETLDDKNHIQSLKNAIVTTLLLPDDPRAADLFNAGEIKFGETPYLYKEIIDDQNQFIRYEWRASRFADVLIEKGISKKTINIENKNKEVFYINIPMVKDHANVRVAKFKPTVEKYSKKFGISENLLYAIIQTESNFNQFAISSANAYGLMQIVPTSAGKDAYKYVKGKTWTPTKSYLFDANNNIELGTAYLKILNENYLDGIFNPVSKEYCVISAYNTGSGNVLRTFSKDKDRAKDLINQKNPQELYDILVEKLPYEETRRYLQKVITYKKEFVGI